MIIYPSTETSWTGTTGTRPMGVTRSDGRASGVVSDRYGPTGAAWPPPSPTSASTAPMTISASTTNGQTLPRGASSSRRWYGGIHSGRTSPGRWFTSTPQEKPTADQAPNGGMSTLSLPPNV